MYNFTSKYFPFGSNGIMDWKVDLFLLLLLIFRIRRYSITTSSERTVSYVNVTVWTTVKLFFANDVLMATAMEGHMLRSPS